MFFLFLRAGREVRVPSPLSLFIISSCLKLGYYSYVLVPFRFLSIFISYVSLVCFFSFSFLLYFFSHIYIYIIVYVCKYIYIYIYIYIHIKTTHGSFPIGFNSIVTSCLCSREVPVPFSIIDLLYFCIIIFLSLSLYIDICTCMYMYVCIYIYIYVCIYLCIPYT